MKFRLQWCLAAVFCTAAFFCLEAAWIPAKAQLAQVLIERAWQRSARGEEHARPWPWADTWPVAVLEVPRLGLRQFVLEGASGRNLAFGPASVTDVNGPDVILSGHRDTHFEFLRQLQPGDRLRLQRAGKISDFVVQYRQVVDVREALMVLDDTLGRLTLLTCYPFDALDAGGPLRYVITALPAG